MPKLTEIEKAIKELGLVAEEIPPPDGAPTDQGSWEPDLNPTQQLIFDDPADHVLGWGEKGSGKTIAFGHKLTRHCYENDNALGVLISPYMRTGNEGIWHDMDVTILPPWKEGIDLEYSDSKLDPNTKDRHRWIRNRFGGWSKLLLMSIPYPQQVEGRVKGPAPSMVYVDELTECDGPEYWTFTSAQLRRRAGIAGPQQFTASYNPKGPKHWVYREFHEGRADDPSFSIYHVPLTENVHRLPPGYKEHLENIFRNNPVEFRRLVEGGWEDKPEGDALFAFYLDKSTHVKGNLARRQGLIPSKRFPVMIGYDLGQVNSSIVFMQLIVAKDRNLWVVFDEIHITNKKTLYRTLAQQVMSRMQYWSDFCDHPFNYFHITDDSAINQWRPGGDGSYDAWEFEKEFNKEAEVPIKMKGAPKGSGSVPARVRMLQAKLNNHEIVVSATCPAVLGMLELIVGDPKDPEKPKRCGHLHKFDALTYPMFWVEVKSRRLRTPEKSRAPGLTAVGSSR